MAPSTQTFTVVFEAVQGENESLLTPSEVANALQGLLENYQVLGAVRIVHVKAEQQVPLNRLIAHQQEKERNRR